MELLIVVTKPNSLVATEIEAKEISQISTTTLPLESKELIASLEQES
jgi:hypothetical protein